MIRTLPIVAAWRLVYALCLVGPRVLSRAECLDLVDEILAAGVFS